MTEERRSTAGFFTDRDLDLIEVALESAISAVGSPLTERDDMTGLQREYRHALEAVVAYRAEP
jgi:hypothetical protein